MDPLRKSTQGTPTASPPSRFAILTEFVVTPSETEKPVQQRGPQTKPSVSPPLREFAGTGRDHWKTHHHHHLTRSENSTMATEEQIQQMLMLM